MRFLKEQSEQFGIRTASITILRETREAPISLEYEQRQKKASTSRGAVLVNGSIGAKVTV